MAKKEASEEGAAGEASAPKKSKLKLIIIAAVVLLAGGGGGGWYFMSKRHAAHDQHAEAPPPPKPPGFVDVPEMMVNLAGQPGERVQYLKLKIVLEVKDATQVAKITPALPRVTDIFQTYLRELRANDLNGSAGLFRLKEEMTRRVNAAVSPSEIAAVLFKEVVIQ